MNNQTIAIIPVKDFEYSKLRLSNILNHTERKNLSFYMLEDVLTILDSINSITKIIITTSMKNNINIKKYPKAEIIYDCAADINESLFNAIDYCKKFNTDQILILPSDIPLITPADIIELLNTKIKSNSDIIIVPSNRNDGTNSLLFNSDLNIKTYFGKNSFKLHKSEYSHHFKTKIVKIFRIGIDIDIVEDLKVFLEYSKSITNYSLAYLQAINFSSRIQ